MKRLHPKSFAGTCAPALFFCLLSCVASNAFAINNTPSKERADATLRRRTEIDGNNVRTSVFNFVWSGGAIGNGAVPYEWPKNTGRDYLALVALYFGGEVVDDTGRTIHIVDLPAFRTNPASGADWNMNPVPGYFNLQNNMIAKSDNKATWPAYWPDKLSDPNDPGWKGEWDGYFGKNIFNADQEMYYRVGDDNYTRYLYTPDTTDRRRRGLGLIVDVRTLEWSQVSVADAVFFIQEVKNDGTKNISKAAMTIWVADLVGGDGDSQDDTPDFDLIRDIAFSMDSDGLSSNPAFQNACVGTAATLFLETPGNAVDRIDNDGDSPENPDSGGGPPVTADMLQDEIPGDGIDNNHNGLIDEDSTYIAFSHQHAVTFADGVDNNNNGEPGSPVVTQEMIDQASTDSWTNPATGHTFHWHRWPPNPETDSVQRALDGGPIIGLIMLTQADLGKKFADHIDNNDDGEAKGYNILPRVTQGMIDTAALDPYHRYRVPGTNIILYNVTQADSGKRYLNKDGLRDAGVDENIDEMIDESRNDGIDNDGDWNPITDDVGLDGVANTGDFGENDGKPTSGVGTPFPGEPHIDKTDIKEADQIGLTNVQYLPAGAINFSTVPDIYFWATFMITSSFVNPALIGTGDFDLFCTSGTFPLDAGQIERISYAVVFGNATHCPYKGDPDKGGSKSDALRKRDRAILAYQQNYKFATAPLEPVVTAATGDRSVTLYWDSKAEQSLDLFLQGLGGDPHTFEGYRIYRSTDPAFLDAQVITDALGNPAAWLKPIAQFDLKDGITGFDSVGYNGVAFYLGDDSGLKHSWTDTTVQNGQTYYYAVRAYTKGFKSNGTVLLNISPIESNMTINLDNLTGKVKDHGTSVVIVTPEAPVAGYEPSTLGNIKLVQGSTTGYLSYTVVDPGKVKNRHTYRVTFEDTVLVGRVNGSPSSAIPDTYKTKCFTLADVTDTTAIDTLIGRSRGLSDTVEQPLTDGFRLTLHNDSTFGVNNTLSHWSGYGIKRYIFQQWKSGFATGQQKPSDYKVVFGPVGMDTSTSFVVDPSQPVIPSKPVDFSVYNTSENKKIPFAFVELDQTGGPGILSVGKVGLSIRSDVIVFLEKNTQDSLAMTWSFKLAYDTILRLPKTGDTATIVLSKLFRSSDRFEFTTTTEHTDNVLARSELDRIRVVPNPYVATDVWEVKNPYTTGRGPRVIHFTHLPQVCTIRIYNVSGALVRTLEHSSSLRDGMEPWDLLTRDELTAAYGVYVYHIDAPGIGQKIGKFALIK